MFFNLWPLKRLIMIIYGRK